MTQGLNCKSKQTINPADFFTLKIWDRISEIGVQEISKSENLEPEIAVFEKAENGNLNARKLSATEI